MSIHPQLEQELHRAAQRHLAHPTTTPVPAGVARGSVRRLWALPLVAALALAATTIALAATGVILNGSPVPNSPGLNPHVGAGAPLPGRSRLLTLRASDPAGGPPWGMRLISTTRGEVCLQVGRVVAGQLGELGIDGAFGNDGRFHPLPSGAMPAGEEEQLSSLCHFPGETFGATISGMDRNATGPLQDRPPGRTSDRSSLRELSFGLLGSHAISVTYTLDGTVHSQTLQRPLGAYLIVGPMLSGDRPGSIGASYGGNRPGEEAGPIGALRTVTYRLAHGTCTMNNPLSHLADTCPRPRAVKPAPAPPAVNLHVPVHVKLRVSDGLVYAARISFRAPFAVTNALSGYSVAIPLPCHGGTMGASIDRDISRGQTVTLNLPYVFTNACRREPMHLAVIYNNPPPPRPGRRAPLWASRTIIVGATELRLPPGTNSAQPPTPKKRRP
jgi:hypothetical protein